MKNIVETIEISDMKKEGPTVDYADNDIIVTGNMEDIMCGHDDVRLGLVLVVFCMEGRMQLEMNDRTCTLHGNDMMICLPHHIIGGILLGNNLKIKAIGFSPSFVHDTIRGEREFGSVFENIHADPVRRLRKDRNEQRAVNLFGKLIAAKMNDVSDCGRRRILHHMFAAFLCQVMVSFGASPESRRAIGGERKSVTLVFKNFMKELNKDDGRHRSVSYYADRLCYSPKYVSYAVKLVSGRTAMSWINEHAIGQIKYQLRNSDKSIKEIAEIFEFPNISFFGKYVKRNLGVSPLKYRNGQ